jgi:lysylphosphatidylglycerol synthetase-like protein (DUF2156 family)
MDWNPLALCGAGTADEGCAVLEREPPTSPFVGALFSALYRRGAALYNTQGLARWKARWRPTTGLAYCAVQRPVPVIELLAALALIY